MADTGLSQIDWHQHKRVFFRKCNALNNVTTLLPLLFIYFHYYKEEKNLTFYFRASLFFFLASVTKSLSHQCYICKIYNPVKLLSLLSKNSQNESSFITYIWLKSSSKMWGYFSSDGGVVMLNVIILLKMIKVNKVSFRATLRSHIGAKLVNNPHRKCLIPFQLKNVQSDTK